MVQAEEIRNDEIRVIGYPQKPKPPRRRWQFWALVTVIVLALAGIAWLIVCSQDTQENPEQPECGYFERQDSSLACPDTTLMRLGHNVNSDVRGFTEMIDTMVNDIPLSLFIPHNAWMSLHVGRMDLRDTTVVFAAQAADIRGDNGKILGAFVLKGEPLAWGLSQKGFCASIEGKVTIGVADNSPLFEEAAEHGGYFFRQYPLVKDGAVVENEPKNKSIRRAICDRQGEIFMAESQSRESFHDFAQALVDLGVSQAVYLIGSDAYGWAVDENGERHEFGNTKYYTGGYRIPENINYMVWRRLH